MSQEESQEVVVPKKRGGRPKGSKNKPRSELLARRSTNPHIAALLAKITELEAKLAATQWQPPSLEQAKINTEIAAGLHGGPPMPPMDPLQGDKTPAVVEWYRDYHPEEFARRYKDRKTHLRPNIKRLKVVHDEEGNEYERDEEGNLQKKMKASHEAGLNTEPRLY